MRAPTRLASGLELTEDEISTGRQRLAAVGAARASRDGYALGAAALVLDRLLSGDADITTEQGRASVRSVLALVAVAYEQPTQAETLAARIAEAEQNAQWMDEHDRDRADRYRIRAAGLRAELAAVEAKARTAGGAQ